MPFGTNYQPFAPLVADAGRAIGLGEFNRQEREFQENQRRYADQQAQQAARTGLAEDQLALEAQNQDWRQQFAYDQLGNQNRMFGAQMLDRQLGRQDALANQAMQGAQEFQLAGMREEGVNQRAQNSLVGQLEAQSRAELWRRMKGDWDAIEAFARTADADEIEEARSKFQDKYANAGMPMPVELPQEEIPDYMNPDKIWDEVKTNYPDVPFVPDDQGLPQVPRGYNYTQSPSGIKQKNDFDAQQKEVDRQHEIEVEKMRTGGKEIEQAFKVEEFKFDQLKAKQDLRHNYFKMRMDGLKQTEPQVREFTTPGTGVMSGPTFDKAGFDKAHAAWEQKGEELYKQFYGDDGLPAETAIGSEVQAPVPVSSRAELEALKPGQKFVLPDGRTGTRS